MCFPSLILAGSRPGGRDTFLAPPRKVSQRRRPLLSARCAGSRLAVGRAGSARNSPSAQTTLASYSARPTASRRFAKGKRLQCGGKTTIFKLPALKKEKERWPEQK